MDLSRRWVALSVLMGEVRWGKILLAELGIVAGFLTQVGSL